MKKIAFVVLFASSLLFSLATTLAYPFCSPNQAPNQYEQFCRHDLTNNDTYRIRSDIPFAWLRSDPSSTAAPIATILHTTGASLITSAANTYWDGYQWWWQMTTYPRRDIKGWVEQSSMSQIVIESVTATPTIEGVNDASIQVLAHWEAPFRAVLDTSENVSFAWVREQPAAGNILYTIRANEPFQVTGSAGHDGYQWWWPVEINTRKGLISGWVEQGSIAPLN